MPRLASCACGGLNLTIEGEPASVYACACHECQRATGTAFSYRARFRKGAIAAMTGERRAWRRGSDAGRWVEQTFCPTCGTLVYMSAEALPDDIVVSAGCIAEADLGAPAKLFWASRRPAWYCMAEGVQEIPPAGARTS